MQSPFLANRCLNVVVIFTVAIATASSVMGQTIGHPGIAYFEEGSASQTLHGHKSPLMLVGHGGVLRPMFLKRGQACEPIGLDGCEEECSHCGGRVGLFGSLFAGGNSHTFRVRCLFCGGDGCSVCMNRLITLPELFEALKPYRGAGLSEMRWYDASVEATFLSHSQGGPRGLATTDGIAGVPALSFSEAETGESLKGGIRLSAAVMFGPRGNMEVSYLGGNEWDQTAIAESDPAGTATLYSLISNFGTSPNGGFDDTDRSVSQTIHGESKFHSGEWNYRRRSMGQYGRFQSSWLVGVRYVRFDSTLNYSALGLPNNTISSSLPRYFSSFNKVKNNLFGPQAGADLWWNLRPGVNLGVGVKGAWVQNDSKHQTIMTSNSLSVFATPGSVILEETRRKATVIGEIEATAIYRISHSWSAKASYHLLAADDVVFGNIDVPTARDFVSGSTIREPSFTRDSLVVQGATIGAEYMW